MAYYQELINVALGKEPADIVIRGGNLINVNTGEIYQTDIAVKGSRIASIGPLADGTEGEDTKVIDASGYYLSPGFIDAHIHIESSLLTYTEFSKMVVKHGTTAVASDLMEVTIVSGSEGMKELLRESKDTPVKLYYPVPSFMEEESELQTIGSALHSDLIRELIELPEAIGIAEVLYPPILNGSPQSKSVLELPQSRGKTAEGHAPALTGSQLNAYVSTGIRSDHECTNKEEALEKLRSGLRVLLREGSASTDLIDGIRVVTEEKADARHIALISDDIDALHISNLGHMDHKVRLAVRAGVPPVTAIQMVTINPAEGLKLDDEAGSITPGKYADIVFLSSLEECQVEKVISKGELVVDHRTLTKEYGRPEYSSILLNTVKLVKPVEAGDLLIKTAVDKGTARVHVIGADSRSLLTESLEAKLWIEDGVVLPDVQNDILSIACVERYGKHGSVGKSFIKGVGLKEGAIALSVGHDHHNITVVGSDSEDMAFAVNRIEQLQGGIVLVRNKEVLGEIPLPICGLLSPDDGEIVADKLRQLIASLNQLGSDLPSPNVTLSFITLIFIPKLAVTDRGLFDVLQFRLIDPIIEINEQN